MLKKIFISLTIVVVIIAAAIYVYRYAIIQYYAEKIIRENLPAYIKIDKIRFNFTSNTIFLDNLKLASPPGYSSPYLLEIAGVSCRYSVRGRFIPEGLEISEVLVKRPEIVIERLKNGRINAPEMESFLKSFPAKKLDSPQSMVHSAKEDRKSYGLAYAETEIKPVVSKKLSDIIKLPSSFILKDGKITFRDALPYDRPHVITVESVNGEVSIIFDDNYSRILNVAFTLDGYMNGERRETIKWIASLNPTTPRLTMSNRFEVSDLDIVAFEPYYDSFSPFVFKRGRFSGTLVFDFNNGNIGSTNEVHISHYLFYVKSGYENSQMWGTTVPELLRYFTTPSGEVVFDFKLKGDMSNPRPELGPISKSAITSMVINKAANFAIDQFTNQSGGSGGTIDKAKGAIGLLKGLIKK